MAVSHQRAPTFSFSGDAQSCVGEDDLVRAQILLGGGSGGQGDYYDNRRPWDADTGPHRRSPYAPAPTVARYREEMMDMVRRSGTPTGDGGGGGSKYQEQPLYELSLRDLVELPSAARALREGADLQGEKKAPAASEEMGMRKKASRKEKNIKVGKNRDVIRDQNFEDGVLMLKMFSYLPGVLGGGSEKQGRKDRLAAAARSKVTPAPKAVWNDDEDQKSEKAWEKSHQSADKASRSSSGSGSQQDCGSSPKRKTRRFPGCYSFLHTARR